MAETFVEVKGLKELDRKLKQLEPKLAKKVMRKAVSAGAEVIRKEARQLAPRRTGFLIKNIIKSVKRRGSTVVAKIGTTKRAFYGIFVEFGTKTGTPMKPFLRPAFDTQGRRSISVIREKIASELRRLVRA